MTRRQKVVGGAAAAVAAGTVAVGSLLLAGGVTQATCGSLASAVGAASPGSTVQVAGGPCTIQVNLLGISKSPPVSVVPADPANPPVFRGAGQTGYPAVYVSSSSGITLGPGLVFTNPVGTGLQIENSTNIAATGDRFMDNGGGGALVQTYGGSTSSGIVLELSEFGGNGWNRAPDPHTPKGDGNHSIYYGGQFGATTGGRITGNWVHDSLGGMAIQLGPTAVGTVVNANTVQRAPYTQGSGTHIDGFACIGTFNDVGRSPTTSGVQIRGNVCQDSAGWATQGVGNNLQAQVVGNVADRVGQSPSFRAFYGAAKTHDVGSNWDENLGDLKLGADGVPAASSPLVGKADPAYLPPVDLNGRQRTGKTLGALEPASGPPPPPADSLPLTVTNETSSTVTVSWTAPAGGYGFAFLRDGVRVSSTFDATRSTATFGKPAGQHRYEVVAFARTVSGSVTR